MPVHKKRPTKKSKKTESSKTIMTIPELRRAFEHVEEFVEIHSEQPIETLVSHFQEEWKKTFRKEVDKGSARAYVEHALSQLKAKNPKHRKHYGGAMALSGAPLDYTTRPGLYITPGVDNGSYALVPKYVDSGFWNPEQGRDYDPVPGQTHYVTRTPEGLGSNAVHFGGGKRVKGTRKRKQSGGDILGTMATAIKQAFFAPQFATEPPPSFADDAIRGMRGQSVGMSPDASQRHPNYILTDNTPLLSGTTVKGINATLDKHFYSS